MKNKYADLMRDIRKNLNIICGDRAVLYDAEGNDVLSSLDQAADELERQEPFGEDLGETCIDGGKCHHSCTVKCFRRECCGPLTGYAGPWSYDKPPEDQQATPDVSALVEHYPADEWIPNNGQRPDLPAGTLVEVKFLGGYTDDGYAVDSWLWRQDGEFDNITHYRIHQPAPDVQGEPVDISHDYREQEKQHAEQQPVEHRCEYCDGTGDAHSLDGEWRGTCSCPAGRQPAPDVSELVEALEHLKERFQKSKYLQEVCNDALAAHRKQGGEV